MQWMKQEPLFGRDRPFSQSSYIPSEGLDSTSGRSFPGNVAVPGVGNRNPLYPNCAPSLAADPEVYPGQCRFDPNPFLGSLPEVEKFNLVARGTFQLTPDHQAFIEGLTRRTSTGSCCSRCRSGKACCSRRRVRTPQGSSCRRARRSTRTTSPRGSVSTGSRSTSSGARSTPGLRDSTTTAEQTRIVAGFKGVVKGWDYEAAYSYNQSKDTDHLNGGYLSQAALLPIINSGNVNRSGPTRPRSSRSSPGTAIQADAALVEVDGQRDRRQGQQRDLQPAGRAARGRVRRRVRKEKYDSVSADICRRATSSATARRARPSPAIARCTRSSPRRSCRSSRPRARRGVALRPLQRLRLDDQPEAVAALAADQDSSSRARRTARASARRRSPSCSRRR
jgi:hypothetical protein